MFKIKIGWHFFYIFNKHFLQNLQINLQKNQFIQQLTNAQHLHHNFGQNILYKYKKIAKIKITCASPPAVDFEWEFYLLNALREEENTVKPNPSEPKSGNELALA